MVLLYRVHYSSSCLELTISCSSSHSCVVAMVTMITTTIVITLSCCLLKKHKRSRISKSTNTLIMVSPVTMHVYIEAAKPPTGVVPVSSNPAYGEITTRSIMMKENTAYATVQLAILPQYKNVVMKENNDFAVALMEAACSVVSF